MAEDGEKGLVKRNVPNLTDVSIMYQRLVEFSPDAIILYRGDRFLYVNPAAVAMFGAQDASELLDHAPIEFVAEEHREDVLASLARLDTDSGYVHRMGFILHTLDGRNVDVEATSTVIMQNGEPVYQGMIRDVTEQNMLHELQRANQEWRIFRKIVAHLADKTLNPLSVIEGFLDLQKEGADISPELLLKEAKLINDTWERLIIQSQRRRDGVDSPLSFLGNDTGHTDT